MRLRNGFSLVELSIVLVILGLLVGGILAGQSLIRAAELRAVGTEYDRYVTATHAFRDKYFALPGDMKNATTIWNEAAAGASCATTAGTGTATCNGDGNGLIQATGTSIESFRYWQQLVNAGLIEGRYDGIAHGANVWATTRENAPSSKLSGGLWYLGYWGPITGGDLFDGNYDSFYMFGLAAIDGAPENNILRPEEMWNIDKKIDDGAPGRGNLVARYWGGSGCNNATSATDYAATYNLTDKSVACRAIFRPRF